MRITSFITACVVIAGMTVNASAANTLMLQNLSITYSNRNAPDFADFTKVLSLGSKHQWDNLLDRQQYQMDGALPLPSNLYEEVVTINISGADVCTGVVIAPHAVLTAAHCFFDSCGALRKPPCDPKKLPFAVKVGCPNHPTATTPAGEPACYGGQCGTNADYDIAVLTTRDALPAARRIAASTAPFDSATDFIALGRGLDDRGIAFSVARIGTFRYLNDCAQSPNVGDCGGATEFICDGKIEPPFTRPSAVCNGDSGGPVLLRSSCDLVAVIRATPSRCIDRSAFTHVDRDEVRTFLARYVIAMSVFTSQCHVPTFDEVRHADLCSGSASN